MTDHLVGVNGIVQIDPNEVLGIVRDEGVVTGASVLLWPGRWRIALREGVGGGGGSGGPVTWADITGKPSAYPPEVEGTQDIVGAMVAGAGGTYDDAAGTITLPSGGGGPVALDVSPNLALWVVSPTSSTMGGYSSAHRLFTSTLMPLPMTVHGLAITCETADTDATITLALYQGFSATNQVARVTPDLTMPLSAVGEVQIALPEPVTLSAGPLFIGYHTSGTTARVRAGTNAYPLYRVRTGSSGPRQARFINTNNPLPSNLDIDTTTSPTNDSPPAVGLLAVAP